MIAILNGIILVVFMVLLVFGAGATVLRGLAYWNQHQPLPRLLVRDIISRTGLAIPLALVFGVRFFHPPADLGQNVLWLLITGVPAIISVATYAYYEVFVISGPDRSIEANRPLRQGPHSLAEISRKIDENTEISRDAFTEANTVNQKIADLRQSFDDLIEQTIVANRRRDVIDDARYAASEASKTSVRLGDQEDTGS